MPSPALSAVDAALLDANRLFVSYSDTGEYLERAGLALVSCGLPVAEMNWGFLKPPYRDVPAAAAFAREYFDGRRFPFAVTFPQADAELCASQLAGAGWRTARDPSPGMTLPISPGLAIPACTLDVREVRTPDELLAYREAAFRGFGLPMAGAPIFLNERVLALPQVRMYAGWIGDTVVSTSMLAVTDSVAGIYWVSTLESHRGKGYGESLTWACVAAGRDRGCSVASLQASKLGRPVYARMGFAHALDYAWWAPLA